MKPNQVRLNAFNSLMDLLIFKVHKVDLINYRFNEN